MCVQSESPLSPPQRKLFNHRLKRSFIIACSWPDTRLGVGVWTQTSQGHHKSLARYPLPLSFCGLCTWNPLRKGCLSCDLWIKKLDKCQRLLPCSHVFRKLLMGMSYFIPPPPALLRYKWHLTFKFKVCKVMIWYMGLLHNAYHNKVS